MTFTSLTFLVFFLIVWLVYLALPGFLRAAWLLAASWLFAASLGANCLAALLVSTLMTYLAGIWLERRQARQNIILAAAVAFHILLLAFFKYNRQNILLPVGLSFYTFQAIGYLVDVARGDLEAEHNLLRFALFQAFFPRLTQGPIERGGRLLAQIRRLTEQGTPVQAQESETAADQGAVSAQPAVSSRRSLCDPERIRRAALLILWGLCEKLLVADRIAIPVNAVYSQFGAFGGVEIALATLLYAFQIYCDFAGYTDIARGAAALLGFDLAENFRRPYLADSIQDFWRRWHRTLSSWLRDYLYIPLGGSRKGHLRGYLNLLITFAISGLWHGTGFHFLLWGLLHGFGQAAEKAVHFREWKLPRALKRLLVFLFVDLTWMVFRVNSLGDLKGMLRLLLTDFRLRDFAGLGLGGLEWLLLLLGILLVLLKDLANERGFSFQACIYRQNAVLRCLIYTALLAALIIFGVYGAAYDTSGFLYTQF